MDRHEYFDLQVHTTVELEHLLDEDVVERREVHVWPLSSVQLVVTADGRRWIYKTQREPTVEPEFYARAASPLLPAHRTLTRDDTYATMLIEFLGAPRLHDLELDEEAIVDHSLAVMDHIGQISNVPVYIDISTSERWTSLVDTTLTMLGRLIAAGRFTTCTQQDAAMARRWAGTAQVAAVIDQTSQLTQGDAADTHVFLCDDGYRVIDWQRPQLAPRDVDLVGLLDSRGVDPRPHVVPEVIGVFWFLRLFWAVEAKTHLLPDLPVFGHWAAHALQQLHGVSDC